MPKPDEFEHWLQAEYQAQDYLDDDGFSDRVMFALPERPARKSAFGWIQIVAVMLGCLVAAWNVPVLGMIYDIIATADMVLLATSGAVVFATSLALVVASVRSRVI